MPAGFNKGENNPMYGRKVSKGTRAKISKALKGAVFSDQHRANISKAKKGVKWPEGIPYPQTGKKLSEEHKLKISRSLKGKFAKDKNPNWGKFGKLNPNWKGGKSYEHRPAIWFKKKFRDSIKERDMYKCRNPSCDGKSITLCIHHIDYDKMNCNKGNLITLCMPCNAKANFNRDYWEEFYSRIVMV